MSVEQTSQLIQLILNSVLMVVAGVVVLGALLVRHTAINNRLRSVNQEYFQLVGNAVMWRGDRLIQLKKQLHQLRQRYRVLHDSLLTAYFSLVILVTSTFLMALRTLVDWEWLIPVSLTLFTLGVGVLLLGIGLALIDFHASRQSLLEELNWVLSLGENAVPASKLLAPPKRLAPRYPPRRSLQFARQGHRKVGIAH